MSTVLPSRRYYPQWSAQHVSHSTWTAFSAAAGGAASALCIAPCTYDDVIMTHSGCSQDKTAGPGEVRVTTLHWYTRQHPAHRDGGGLSWSVQRIVC